MNKKISECQVLITGGNQGLGKAFKEALEELGADVYITSRKNVPKCFFWDMSNDDSTKDLLKALEEKNVQVDILIHCAHIFSDKKLIPQIKPLDFKNSLNQNIVPIYELSRGLTRGMSRRGFGRVLYIGSLISQYGGAGKVSYITEKAALSGMVKAFHAEFASKNVFTNIVHPNLFETPDIHQRVPAHIIEEMKKESPTGNLMSMEEVIKASLPLVMPESTKSGEVVLIDGGVKW